MLNVKFRLDKRAIYSKIIKGVLNTMAKEITTEQIEMLEEMVARARKAAAIIETYDQDRVDHLCQAVAAALYDLKVWAQLSDEAVDETNLGDKVTKRNKRNKLKLILRDCMRSRTSRMMSMHLLVTTLARG